MGQFEKIVVLTVLSLIAVILVISFSSDEDPLAGIDGAAPAGQHELAAHDAGALPAPIQGRAARQPGTAAPDPAALDLRDPFSEPRSSSQARTEPESLVRADAPREWPVEDQAPASAAEETSARGLLLSATVRDAAPREADLPEGAALITLVGLEDSFDAELKLYTWRDGDSFTALARRYYGDATHAALLTLHNEGRESVPAGDTILVPVFDRRGAAPTRVSAVPTHLVQDGESLWSIAKKQYGRGNDWQRIYEANSDRLASPDDVRAGMELRLP